MEQAISHRTRKIAYLVGAIVILIGSAAVIFSQKESNFSTWETPVVVDHSQYEKILHAPVPEIGGDMVMYRHIKTHTEVSTVVPHDTTQDSVFGISFRTLPADSKGEAHILEHSVLSGSEKYPVKDPFNELQRGSLQTFLNAMTYNDRTVYPIASRNAADFSNLMSVYLDAVFRPRVVTPEGSWIMRQEGWRVDQNEDSGEFEFNGVVLSEMKGAYSDPEDLMYRYSQTMLFPDSPYRHDSGGEPSKIPTLKREEFVRFYETFYHPTNAQVFLYGPLENIREGLNQADKYFQHYDARPDVREASRVPWQKMAFKEPVRSRMPYPGASDEAGSYQVMISWLVNDEIIDEKIGIAWTVLDHLLMGTPTSVLNKALLESKLGEDIIGYGYDDTLMQSVFQVGMKGVQQENDLAAVEAIILRTLNDVVENGFDPNDVYASLNTVEFELRDQSGRYPRGITVFLNSLSAWNYDQDPRVPLQFEAALEDLKVEIETSGSGIFTSIVKSALLENNHRAVLELFPSADFAKQEKDDELNRLEALKADPAFQSLIEESNQLAKVHDTDDTPEVLATIPRLQLKDLDRTGDEFPITVENDVRGSGATVLYHEVLTSSGIAYVDFGIDTSRIDVEDVYLLPLLCRMIKEIGRDEPDGDINLARQIGLHTGGIHVEHLMTRVRPEAIRHKERQVLEGTHLSTKLFLRGKCTADKALELFNLFEIMLLEGNLDSQEKATAILKEIVATRQDALVTRGHHAALNRIKARYDPHGFLVEELDGLTGLKKLVATLEEAQDDWNSVLVRLQLMKNAILEGHRNGIVLNLTGDKSVLAAIDKALFRFLDEQLPKRIITDPFPNFAQEEHPWVAPALETMPVTSPVIDEGIVVSTRVSYVGGGGLLYKAGDIVHGSAAVVSQYLKRGYLYEQLRLQRGAYGAMTSFDVQDGVFVMLSYRDPNLAETLKVYSNTPTALNENIQRSNGLGSEAEDAIIGTIGAIDGSAPQPNEVGWLSLIQWLHNESPEIRQNWRNSILDTKQGDFVAFAERLAAWRMPSVAVVSSPASFQKAASEGFQLELITLP